MKGRCGLEDCDCGYTISKLSGALEWALRRVNLSYARPGELANYRDACALLKVHKEGEVALCCPLCDQPSLDGETHQECADREQYTADADVDGTEPPL